jgi:CubicO group peptidase (beta-lactamase class C family)
MGIETKLERAARKVQARSRVPALAVALQRADRPLWAFQVGTAGPATTLDADTQFRFGSVTKTFTAVLVLQCRDAGLLELDDPIGRHLDVPAHGQHSIRDLLSHRSGIQREPYGNVWDEYAGPDAAQVLADLDKAGQVLPPHRRFHYSNLAFALLGHLAAAKRGGSWEEVLQEYVLRPLRLSGVSVQPTDKAATGYLVDRFSDHARPEPATDIAGIGPAAQLWGTASDAARWAAFLTDPATIDFDGRVLSAQTLAEARQPHTIRDEALWSSGIGLGVMLEPQGDRIMHLGHYGAMYGFLAACFGRTGPDQPAGMGAAVLASSGTASASSELVHELLRLSATEDQADIAPWTPGEPAPPEYASALGRWWSEGFGFEFGWHDGALQARSESAPRSAPPSVFTPVERDVLRTVSGREAGELLELVRDGDGDVVSMRWATYAVTRHQDTPLLQP